MIRTCAESAGPPRDRRLGQEQGRQHFVPGVCAGFELAVSGGLAGGEAAFRVSDLRHQQRRVHLERRTVHRAQDDGRQQPQRGPAAAASR